MSLEGFLGTYIDQRYRPFNSSLRLLFNNIWIFTGSIPGYVGRRYKRNDRTQTIVVVNVVVVQVARVHVPNVSVTAIKVVRRQGPPNARTQAQKCLLTTQHSSYYKSIHIVIAKINVQNTKPSWRQLACSKRKFRMPVAA